MKAAHLIITGRVQGVGFREWLAGEARRLGLDGWVRNAGQDAVEALIAGDTDAVEECVRACRRGPVLAQVDTLNEKLAEPPEQQGFYKLASVSGRA